MVLPVAVEPVNDITGMSGCLTIGAPALAPVPNTKLTTPGGRPVINLTINNIHEKITQF